MSWSVVKWVIVFWRRWVDQAQEDSGDA